MKAAGPERTSVSISVARGNRAVKAEKALTFTVHSHWNHAVLPLVGYDLERTGRKGLYGNTGGGAACAEGDA